MAKPIFIIGFPIDIQIHDNYAKRIKDDLSDYHVLVYLNADLPEPKFQVFYDKDIDEKKIEEVQQIILEEIKSCGSQKN